MIDPDVDVYLDRFPELRELVDKGRRMSHMMGCTFFVQESLDSLILVDESEFDSNLRLWFAIWPPGWRFSPLPKGGWRYVGS